MYPKVYASFHTFSLSNVYGNESWVWYQISGLCDTITLDSSPGLLAILVLIYIMDILQL